MGAITEQAFRDDSDEVVQRVETGEALTTTRGGRPFAEIRPVEGGRQRFMSKERLLALLEGAAPIDRHRFRADLDAVIDPWFQAR